MLLVLLYCGATWCNVIHSQRLPFIILSYQSFNQTKYYCGWDYYWLID